MFACVCLKSHKVEVEPAYEWACTPLNAVCIAESSQCCVCVCVAVCFRIHKVLEGEAPTKGIWQGEPKTTKVTLPLVMYAVYRHSSGGESNVLCADVSVFIAGGSVCVFYASVHVELIKRCTDARKDESYCMYSAELFRWSNNGSLIAAHFLETPAAKKNVAFLEHPRS